MALYHPRNQYLLSLSHEAPDRERHLLAVQVRKAVPAVKEFGNVDVVGKADAMTKMGSSGLAACLRGAAAMLRLYDQWDWFVLLSAKDYPLVTQDDLIHVFSSVPRGLNFIDHTSDIGWKEAQRVQPIIVDAGTYLTKRSSFFKATEKRKTPDAFKFFTGAPWVILSRPFVEYCILGWENLPRALLMYFTNVLFSEEGYFHSVACNSPHFKNTTVNHSLRFIEWDDPPGTEPRFLNTSHFDKIVHSGLPFARKFHKDEPLLDLIDEKVLNRKHGSVAPGGWCSAKSSSWYTDQCSEWGDVNVIKPGFWAVGFGRLMERLVSEWRSRSSSCE